MVQSKLKPLVRPLENQAAGNPIRQPRCAAVTLPRRNVAAAWLQQQSARADSFNRSARFHHFVGLRSRARRGHAELFGGYPGGRQGLTKDRRSFWQFVCQQRRAFVENHRGYLPYLGRCQCTRSKLDHITSRSERHRFVPRRALQSQWPGPGRRKFSKARGDSKPARECPIPRTVLRWRPGHGGASDARRNAKRGLLVELRSC